MTTANEERPGNRPLLSVWARLARAVAVLCTGTLLGLTLAYAFYRQPFPTAWFPSGYLAGVTADDLALERTADANAARDGAPAGRYPPAGLWHLRAIHAQEAWDELQRRGATSPTFPVGLFDGVIDPEHPDLAGVVDGGLLEDAGLYAQRWAARDNHGTALMGILAGRGLPGITGVNPTGRVVPFGTHATSRETNVAASLQYFASRGVRVANYSIAPPWPVVDQDAVDAARRAGVLLVTGLPNRDAEAMAHPAALQHTLTVSGVQPGDAIGGFGWGPLVDVTAPGPWVLSSAPRLKLGPLTLGPPYQRICCNSVAVAITSAVAALTLQADPTLTAGQLEKRLKLSARKPVGMDGARWHPRYGYGVVDALRAITYDTTGPEIAVVSATRTPAGIVVTGGAIDTTDDALLEPGRARDQHLVGVAVSNVVRVEVRAGDGPWVEATITVPDTGRQGVVAGPVRFDATVPAVGPVRARAWDSAGNVGAEVLVEVAAPGQTP